MAAATRRTQATSLPEWTLSSDALGVMELPLGETVLGRGLYFPGGCAALPYAPYINYISRETAVVVFEDDGSVHLWIVARTNWTGVRQAGGQWEFRKETPNQIPWMLADGDQICFGTPFKRGCQPEPEAVIADGVFTFHVHQASEMSCSEPTPPRLLTAPTVQVKREPTEQSSDGDGDGDGDGDSGGGDGDSGGGDGDSGGGGGGGGGGSGSRSFEGASAADLDEWLRDFESTEGLTLDADQRHCCDIACRRRQHLFYSGPGGVGKSLVTRAIVGFFKHTLPDWHNKIAIVAPTGIAAMHIGGTTYHSATGIGVPQLSSDFKRMWGRKEVVRRWEVILLDEVSMASGEVTTPPS